MRATKELMWTRPRRKRRQSMQAIRGTTRKKKWKYIYVSTPNKKKMRAQELVYEKWMWNEECECRNSCHCRHFFLVCRTERKLNRKIIHFDLIEFFCAWNILDIGQLRVASAGATMILTGQLIRWNDIGFFSELHSLPFIYRFICVWEWQANRIAQ